MTKKICALLIAAVMLTSLSITALAATSLPELELSGSQNGAVTDLVVSVSGAEGVTNGRIEVTYDADELELTGVAPGDDAWVVSVNDESLGRVYFAWVGSDLPGETTLLCTLELKAKSSRSVQVEYTARAEELYDSGVSRLGEEEISDSLTMRSRKSSGGGGYIAPPAPVTPDEPDDPTNPDGSDVERPAFTDVPKSHWAWDEITTAAGEGWVNGTGDGAFSPDNDASRGQFATILWRMAGKPEAGEHETFTDLVSGAYYEDGVNWAAGIGVIKGTGDGKVSPDKSISRQEAVTILCRYAGSMGKDTAADGGLDKFTDRDEIAPWAADSVSWAVQNGIIKGTPDNKMEPERDITRAEMAVMLVRFASYMGWEV